jgi:hypothetical protein
MVHKNVTTTIVDLIKWKFKDVYLLLSINYPNRWLLEIIRMNKYDVKVKQTKLIMIKLKNPIKISNIGKRTSLSIPLVMKIIILFY